MRAPLSGLLTLLIEACLIFYTVQVYTYSHTHKLYIYIYIYTYTDTHIYTYINVHAHFKMKLDPKSRCSFHLFGSDQLSTWMSNQEDIQE